MSPLHALVRQISSTLPAGAKLYVIAVEVPAGSPAEAPADSASAASVSPLLTSLPAGEDVIGPCLLDAATRPGATPLQRVQRVREQHGASAAFKAKDWAPVAKLSVREICRAMKEGALKSAPKGDGRDHGARVIEAGTMEAYLRTVDAVERGTMEPPRWWTEVRGARAE